MLLSVLPTVSSEVRFNLKNHIDLYNRMRVNQLVWVKVVRVKRIMKYKEVEQNLC